MISGNVPNKIQSTPYQHFIALNLQPYDRLMVELPTLSPGNHDLWQE